MLLISKDFKIATKSEFNLFYILSIEPHVERNAGIKNFKETNLYEPLALQGMNIHESLGTPYYKET